MHLDVVLELLPEPSTPICGGSAVTDFEDVTVCAGLSNLHVLPGFPTENWYNTGQGFADLDGDGWLDVLITSKDGSNRLFLGSVNGGFVERIEPELTGKIAGPLSFADYDQDGDADVYLGGRGEGWLFENTGTGLTHVLDGPSNDAATMGVSWSDLDGDGYLELYAAQYRCTDCFAPGVPTVDRSRDNLWSYTGVAWVERGALLGEHQRSGLGFVAALEDWDDDGDIDIMVANDKGRSTLPDDPTTHLKRNAYWRNDGPGCGWLCLTEVARNNGVNLDLEAMGIARADLDFDGDLDAAISDNGPVALLMNQGGGLFIEQGALHGLVQPTMSWGIAFADIDNDGDEDLMLADANEDRLLVNDAGQFTEDPQSGIPDLRMTYGLAVADYDRDGKLDVMLGDNGWAYRMMRNVRSGPTGGWVGIELRGRPGDPGGTDALGASVRLLCSDGQTRTRWVSSGNSLGAGSDRGLHFGLGALTITTATVRWPDGVEMSFDPTPGRWQRATRR